MDRLARFFRNGLYAFKGLYGFLKPQIYILVMIVNPIFQVVFFSLTARHAYGSGDITPYIIGNAFVLCVYDAFFGVGTCLIYERSFGTLKLLVAAPCSKFNIFVGKATFYIFDGIITVSVGLLAAVVFFNVRIPSSYVPQLIICLIVSIFTACSMGLLIGSVGLVTRDINLLLNLASMLLMSLSGVNFSTEKLPFFLQKISSVIPLTNALKACKLMLMSESTSYNQIYAFIAKEFVLGVIYCIAAYAAFRLMERYSKLKAAIDIY